MASLALIAMGLSTGCRHARFVERMQAQKCRLVSEDEGEAMHSVGTDGQFRLGRTGARSCYVCPDGVRRCG